MKIAVITHIQHKERNKNYFSYAPYIREMNIWFKNVSSVVIISPRSYSSITRIESKYDMQDIHLYEVPQLSLLSYLSIFKTFFNLPRVIYEIAKAMITADHIHLRCPGNIGLIGCILQIFFPKKPKTVKYAGNWDPNAEQPWSYRLQKKILNSARLSKNIKVLVYGDWMNQSENIIPFFTASFSENEICLVEKEFTFPLKFIFVGSLNVGKRPLFTLKIIEQLLLNKIPVTLEVYGDGSLYKELEEYIKINNLEPFVTLMGNQKLEVLKNAYKSSHFVILASKSEGWPKAIAEAMFFGCIPISTNISCVPWMLDYGKRGLLIPAEIEEACKLIKEEIKNLEVLKSKSKKAQEWSQQYTLEKFEYEINKLLNPAEMSSEG